MASSRLRASLLGYDEAVSPTKPERGSAQAARDDETGLRRLASVRPVPEGTSCRLWEESHNGRRRGPTGEPRPARESPITASKCRSRRGQSSFLADSPTKYPKEVQRARRTTSPPFPTAACSAFDPAAAC